MPKQHSFFPHHSKVALPSNVARPFKAPNISQYRAMHRKGTVLDYCPVDQDATYESIDTSTEFATQRIELFRGAYN